jgi:hypothetical protein
MDVSQHVHKEREMMFARQRLFGEKFADIVTDFLWVIERRSDELSE